MEIKRKYMSKYNWKRVIDKEYVIDNFEKQKLKGKICLLHIKKVTSPLFKNYEGKIVKIVDDNYYWMQIGIEDKNYWITVLFNEKKELIQYYIDITKKNYVDGIDDPYFDDMFLDLVFMQNKLYILDEDELEQALDEKLITKEEYDKAYYIADQIKKDIYKNKRNYDECLKKYLNILLNKLES